MWTISTMNPFFVLSSLCQYLNWNLVIKYYKWHLWAVWHNKEVKLIMNIIFLLTFQKLYLYAQKLTKWERICSGTDGTKRIPEPMLTQINVAILYAVTRPQCFNCRTSDQTRHWLNMKTIFPRTAISIIKNKTVVIPSYIYHRNLYTGYKTVPLYWDGPQNPC